MTRRHDKRPCEHPLCRAWAMRGDTRCAAHAGHVRRARRQGEDTPANKAVEAREERAVGAAVELPTLESEIKFLVERRNRVDEELQKHLDAGKPDLPQALRYLTVLAQVGRSLATMLVQRSALSGARELEDFFDAVGDRVEELIKENDSREPVSNVRAESENA